MVSLRGIKLLFRTILSMLQEERQNIILTQINRHGKTLTAELCKLLKVSIDTVRRDLKELEDAGKIVKVHGGAISKSFHLPFQPAKVYAKQEKMQIAEKALSLVKSGMVILGGGGTVMLEWAKMIPKELEGTFFSVSPLVALEAAQCSKLKVILLGGQVAYGSYICSGASVISQLSDIRADLCLLGANGLSAKEGLTETDWEVAQVKKEMLKVSNKTAVLSIAENLDTVQKIKVAPLKSAHCLITELAATDKRLSKYNQAIHLI